MILQYYEGEKWPNNVYIDEKMRKKHILYSNLNNSRRDYAFLKKN